MTLGASLYIAGMILTGFMTEIWQLYLFFGVMLSASMGIFQVPSPCRSHRGSAGISGWAWVFCSHPRASAR